MTERFKVTKAPEIAVTYNSILKDEETALGKLLPRYADQKGMCFPLDLFNNYKNSFLWDMREENPLNSFHPYKNRDKKKNKTKNRIEKNCLPQTKRFNWLFKRHIPKIFFRCFCCTWTWMSKKKTKPYVIM